MSKITKIPSEIRNILSEKRRCSVMGSFSRLLESLHLDSRYPGENKRENCQLTNLQGVLPVMWCFVIQIDHPPSRRD